VTARLTPIRAVISEVHGDEKTEDVRLRLIGAQGAAAAEPEAVCVLASR
jgi:hypothetical protein